MNNIIMEKLSIEEKARRYDEVVKRVENIKTGKCEATFIFTEGLFEYIFPELKESEGERIRKELIDYFWKEKIFLQEAHSSVEKNPKYHFVMDAIAWLEKQGEHSENNKDDVDIDFTIYHPLKNGKGSYECIPYSFYGTLSSFDEDKDMIDFLHLCFYTKEECNEWIERNKSTDTCDSLIMKGKDSSASEKRDFGYFNKPVDKIEQKPTDKVEPKFNIGDTMRTLQEASNGITNGLPVVVSIDDEYYHCTNGLIAIKEQEDYEYPAMNRRQKPAWSEEDESIYYSILADIKASRDNSTSTLETYYNEQIEWLKSLKDRYTWKPSKEQIEALEHFVRSIGESGYASPYDTNTKLVYSLLQDLKKLKENTL